ncbi:Acetolactate synthase [Candidatus Sulfopaludibacter sp. SbA6]|nr:Acetolactate synthase [Candidatus Sulfopaludibacter sp. SbA6]
MTHADRIVAMLQAAGVRRLFGMPGGGSNADLIEAAGRAGLPFSLAHTETAAAFMASAQAEITGRPGACIATLGPGAASVMNGVANAWLDRVPLLVLTDCHDAAAGMMQHQTLPQGEMFRPVVKWSARLRPENAVEVMRRAIEEASNPPRGPVHLDIAGEVTSAAAGGIFWARTSGGCSTKRPDSTLQGRRPVILLGLGARTAAIASAVRRLCERCGIPALVTYKAKGVVPDRHPWFGGVLTNGALERDILDRADAFLAIGLDPVELLPRPWTYTQPVHSISTWPMRQSQIPVSAELVGDVASYLEAVRATTDWTAAEVSHLISAQRDRMRANGEPGELLPHRVVELVAEQYPGARATVDAGAHMFPVMSFWPAEEPCGVLISNGLATMGFGLPTAIGASLLDTSRPTVAFTGDGGLLMCLGELRTAAREALPLRIIVFVDGALSLIKIKQIQRGYPTDGVEIGDIDWRAIGAGMGVPAWLAGSEESLRACLRETAGHPGPVLIAARIAARTYPDMMRALRGNP